MEKRPPVSTSERKPEGKRGRGFRQTGSLVMRRLRDAGESRGFAVSRVLTHWDEIVGSDLASHTRPVDIRYGRRGIGATLTVLTTGAHAPLVEMQKDRLREQVNSCYGYAAISRIKVTQTSASGFAEGKVAFTPAPDRKIDTPDPVLRARGREIAADVADEGLRVALSELATNILERPHKLRGSK